MAVQATARISLQEVKDGKSQYTHVRYSEDGRTFTAALPSALEAAKSTPLGGRNLVIGKPEFNVTGKIARISYQLPENAAEIFQGNFITVSYYIEWKNCPVLGYFGLDFCLIDEQKKQKWAGLHKDHIPYKPNQERMFVSKTWDFRQNKVAKVSELLVFCVMQKEAAPPNDFQMSISDVKIEVGQTPTKWTPSPEDAAKGTTPARYMATLVTESPIASTNFADYQWVDTKGEKGDKGESGDIIRVSYAASPKLWAVGEPEGTSDGWSTERPILTLGKPYLWRRTEILNSGGFRKGTTYDLITEESIRPNLLPNTDFSGQLKKWAYKQHHTIEGGTNGNLAVACHPFTNEPAGRVDFLQAETERIEKGKTYTISFDGKTPTTGNAIVYAYGDLKSPTTAGAVANIPLTKEFRRYSFSFEAAADFRRVLFARFPNQDVVISSVKLEEGGNATPWQASEDDRKGAALRGAMDWESLIEGFPFEAGGSVDDFLDVVVYNGQYYYCTQNHIKAADKTPSADSKFWKLGTRYELVATKLLLADKAKVENLEVDALNTATNTSYISVENGAITMGKVSNGEKQPPNFRIGFDSDGDVVLQYIKNGAVVGSIGAAFFGRGKGVSNSYSEITLVRQRYTRFPPKQKTSRSDAGTEFVAKIFEEGYRDNGGTLIYNISQNSTPSDAHRHTFPKSSGGAQATGIHSKGELPAGIPDGIYRIVHGEYLTEQGSSYHLEEFAQYKDGKEIEQRTYTIPNGGGNGMGNSAGIYAEYD